VALSLVRNATAPRLIAAKCIPTPFARDLAMTKVKRLPARGDVPAGDTWDLSSLYTDDARWQRDYRAWARRIGELEAFQGRLGDGPARIAECLALELEL